jgi:signal transduction histidine kinase
VVVRVRGGEQAELCVADQGPGVPPEEREVIFQRFQRGRQTGGQAGFGLGLAIGRELAERMQGRLELEPAAEMMPDLNGATLRLTLPVAVAPKVDSLAVG